MQLLIALTALALQSVQSYGAKGDGQTDDTAAIQAAFNACPAQLHFPAGKYNINSSLTTSCALILTGDSPATTTIFQTAHRTLNHAIVAPYPLTIQNLSIDTAPIKKNLGMVAVFRKDEILPNSGPALGQQFTFDHFDSAGFNFGIDIAGTSDTDMLGAVLVKDCKISVSTQPDAVANPVNVRNALSLVVENSTLLGDHNNDHAIYLIGVRKVLIRNNLIRNHGNSAVKLLTGGFHAPACPASKDYTSWTLEHNTIADSKLALAAYTYCGIHLPKLEIDDNTILNIVDTYESDAAAFYLQATCQSVMEDISMSDNIFRDISLSAVFLLSSIQGGPPCPDLKSQGTIANFSSVGDQFINFSTAYPSRYFAISANGPKVLRATVSQLLADGQGNGRGALNLGSVARVNAADVHEVNIAFVARLLLSLHFW